MNHVISVILSLPSVLQNEIFCEWLDLGDLGRLDSAVCNRTHRGGILSSLNEDTCIVNPFGSIVLKEPFAAWVVSRNIKVGGAVIIPEFVAETEACKAFFKATGNFLTIIKYPEDYQAHSTKALNPMRSVVESASKCAKLERFLIDGINIKEVSLRAVLTNCTKLKTLLLLLAHSVSFQEINECGQYIENLHMVMCGADVAPEDPNVQFKKMNTMKWLKCLNHTADSDHERDRLAQFICSNVGLRELHVDNLAVRHISWILESCTELRSLRLNVRWRENNLREIAIPKLIRWMQHLRYLELTGLDLAEPWLLPLLQGCPFLQALYLQNFKEAGEPGLFTEIYDDYYFDDDDPPLTVLHVCTISASTLSHLLHTYPHLTNVGIARSTVDSFDSALQVLHEFSVPELHLHVPQAYSFTNIHLFNNLTALYLHDCKTLTNDQLLTIAHHNQYLTTLYLSGAAISTDTLMELVDVCQELVALHVLEKVYYQEVESFNATLRSLSPSLVTVEVRLKSDIDFFLNIHP